MNKILKNLIGGTVCASILFSDMTVSASNEVAYSDTIVSDFSGYTLYVYTNERTRELGTMYLQNTGTYAKNTFTNSSRCAPYVQVMARGGQWSSAGSIYGMQTRGYDVTARQKISKSIETILGRAEVGYNTGDH